MTDNISDNDDLFDERKLNTFKVSAHRLVEESDSLFFFFTVSFGHYLNPLQGSKENEHCN